MAISNFDLQGVEKRALDARLMQQNLGPQMPAMHNAVPVNAPMMPVMPGASAEPAVTVMLPAMQQAMAPVMPPRAAAPAMPTGADPRGLGANSPLGGFDPRPLSMRGGPMSYSARGAGTNNPNAFRVGQNNRGRGERLLTQQAMRSPVAAVALANLEQQRQQAPLALAAEVAKTREESLSAQRAQMMEMAKTREQRGFDLFKMQMDRQMKEQEALRNRGWEVEDAAAKAAREREQMQAEAIQGVELLPLPPLEPGGQSPGAVAVARTPMGFKMTGGGMVERPQAPVPGPSADDIAAARAMGGTVELPLPSGGKVRFGASASDAAGMQPFKGRTQREGGELDPKTGKKTPVREYVVMEDPATGRLVRRYVEDEAAAAPGNDKPGWLQWMEQQGQ